MAKNVKKIAAKLGADIVEEMPDVGGGAFGAARLAMIIALIRSRLEPSQGERPGRPSDPNWTLSRKVPMSEETHQKLTLLAELASDQNRKVTPMQMAAQLLEQAIKECGEEVGH